MVLRRIPGLLVQPRWLKRPPPEESIPERRVRVHSRSFFDCGWVSDLRGFPRKDFIVLFRSDTLESQTMGAVMTGQCLRIGVLTRMRKKKAFTLVELLVVIAIIAMLVTLLLPAVQAARAAARRTQCTNGLRNLTLGILNYESAQGVLPQGWTAKANNQAEWAWTTYILPYIEEQGLYDALGVNERRLWDVIRDPKLRHLAQNSTCDF